MYIDFHDKTSSVPTDYIDMLQRLLVFTSKREDITQEAEVSVSFVDNQAIKELNRNYRQQDKITDVISFALQDYVEGDVNIVGEDIPLVLGDIVISIDKAEEQATTYNHSLDRELGFLTVHGFLHLLGYDHLNKVDEEKMFIRQKEILEAFRLGR